MSLTSACSNNRWGGLISSERLDIVIVKITRPFFSFIKGWIKGPWDLSVGYSLFFGGAFVAPECHLGSRGLYLLWIRPGLQACLYQNLKLKMGASFRVMMKEKRRERKRESHGWFYSCILQLFAVNLHFLTSGPPASKYRICLSDSTEMVNLWSFCSSAGTFTGGNMQLARVAGGFKQDRSGKIDRDKSKDRNPLLVASILSRLSPLLTQKNFECKVYLRAGPLIL